ncbi:hypothetical protein SACE_2711 [Saccharopolyspora erythraea NRRL 2338]|uniref:Uncharacterized protein n=1 Tax=Saccharopolyspora erythraea (strain ATCC 11635 / DSM 40517 / JCM 4748 / NBRC 13426 / NCIMB 8594 / NRRL 2338) TaxID=405948 RepID=A4FD67_SACEN|nr:hypothetical protein SACE_2711 [Saccharopolyspora erythraea NRRL 2338]
MREARMIAFHLEFWEGDEGTGALLPRRRRRWTPAGHCWMSTLVTMMSLRWRL